MLATADSDFQEIIISEYLLHLLLLTRGLGFGTSWGPTPTCTPGWRSSWASSASLTSSFAVLSVLVSGYWSSLAPTNSLGKLQVRTQIVMKCVVILFKLSVFEQHLEENYLENKPLKIFFLLCQTVPLSRLGQLL